MFTGLVQDIGIVRAVQTQEGGDLRLRIETRMPLSAIPTGASICCSGICLTLVDKSENNFSVELSRETLNRTNAGAWRVMTHINLEPSLKMGDELGGHFVFGHVDSCVRILEIKPEGGSHRLTFEMPPSIAGFVAQKGSIALDGVSLTVNEVSQNSFGVNIIPHTWEKTTLADLKIGDSVNLEVDMLARYVSRRLETTA